MDADMVLRVNPSIDKLRFHSMLSGEVYYLFQGTDTFFYKNVRIVKNNIGITYWGVTHEYVQTPNGTQYDKIEKDDVFIHDIGDGGCKTDKFVRDITLLKKGLETDPNNDRYTFYLANSYRDAGQYDNAIEAYKKRIAIGGWFDEVWHSHYSIGRCYKNKGDMANAVYWWMEAYNFYPNRIENLYEIIHHYRCTGKNKLAYGFYLMAQHEQENMKTNDYLFLQKDVYDYKLDYELSIIGYYCNYRNFDLQKCCLKILNYPYADEGITKNVLSNYKFYSKSIHKHNAMNIDNAELLRTIGMDIPEIRNAIDNEGFVSSTPSLCINNNNELIVNVRFVNYKITESGGYENPGSIATKNVIAVIKVDCERWLIKEQFVVGYNTTYDNLYVGLEDVRLFTMVDNDRVFFNANRGISYHNIVVEHGTVDISKRETISGFVNKSEQREVEKNWVLFEDDNSNMKIVYGWCPLVIGDVVPDTDVVSTTVGLPPMNFNTTHSIETPHLFKYLRGSTNGVLINNEVWFICHAVSYEDRRYYYHMFVVLDSSTYELKKYSPFFTFTGEKVEYTLGFIFSEEPDEFMIGYSIMDCKTDYMIIPKSEVDNMMITV